MDLVSSWDIPALRHLCIITSPLRKSTWLLFTLITMGCCPLDFMLIHGIPFLPWSLSGRYGDPLFRDQQN
ncbi:hypothetical protein BDV30DRAFT_203266 [Aspergillus minisclerotigenes]|uniref:Uncharacterized protein n=1 Tax=Aspergillus minisclerotigenes TaxID=656917 RepID=A0A5N6JJT6_9EURO|nr:hypothetical protein BDV30DRAFT_203266 [Aspergillus minisclerotigenes]